MLRLTLAAILTVAALPAVAGPNFPHAVVGADSAPICPSKMLIETYQLNRLNDPLKAAGAFAKCAQLPPGSEVAVIFQYGTELAGAHVVQVRPLTPGSAGVGYALTSAFSITREVAAR